MYVSNGPESPPLPSYVDSVSFDFDSHSENDSNEEKLPSLNPIRTDENEKRKKRGDGFEQEGEKEGCTERTEGDRQCETSETMESSSDSYFDCMNYDPLEYGKGIMEERRIAYGSVVHGILLTSPFGNSFSGFPMVLACASTSGRVSLYDFQRDVLDPEKNRPSTSVSPTSSFPIQTPSVRFPAHEGAVYGLVTHERKNTAFDFLSTPEKDNFLLSYGEDGYTRVWKWSDFLNPETQLFEKRESKWKERDFSPVLELKNKQRHGHRGSLSPVPSTLCLASDPLSHKAFCGSSDGYSYDWDLTTGSCMREFDCSLGGRVLSLSYSPKNKLLFTGSEDGTCKLWDLRTSKPLTSFHVETGTRGGEVERGEGEEEEGQRGDGLAFVSGGDGRQKRKLSFPSPVPSPTSSSIPPSPFVPHFLFASSSVTALDVDEKENWLICGSSTGSLSLFNLFTFSPALTVRIANNFQPIRSLYARHSVDEIVIGSSLTSPYVHRISISGKLISSTQCKIPSTYSVFVHKDSGVTLVSGYSGKVDVISNFGTHMASFTCTG